MQNLTREFAHLDASTGRWNWSNRRHIPQGYEIWLTARPGLADIFSRVGLRTVSRLTNILRYGAEPIPGTATSISLWQGATLLGTVDIDTDTLMASPDPDRIVRALLATLWANK